MKEVVITVDNNRVEVDIPFAETYTLNFNTVAKILHNMFYADICFSKLYDILLYLNIPVKNTQTITTRQWCLCKFKVDGVDDGIVAYWDKHCMKIRINFNEIHTQNNNIIIKRDEKATNTLIFTNKIRKKQIVTNLHDELHRKMTRHETLRFNNEKAYIQMMKTDTENNKIILHLILKYD